MEGYKGVRYCLLLLCALGAWGVGWGQTLSVEAPRSVYENQQFAVTFSVDGKPSSFEQPVWGEVQVLMGPSVGQSSVTQLINGTLSRSYSYSYRFVCRIGKPGTYTVPSASVVVDGQRVLSQAHTIEVLAHGAAASGEADSPAGQGQSEGADIFVEISLSKRSVYQGEPVEATARIYTRQDLLGFEELQFPDFKGFWVKELDMPQQIAFSPATVRGKKYNMGLLKRWLLYPQRRGEIVVEPLEAAVQYRIRARARSFFDEFMGAYQTATQDLKSSPVAVEVKPLPAGKPAGFLGGVGQLDVRSHLSADSVRTNDAVTYSLTVSGKGNLQLMTSPTLRLPATVEVFPPKSEEKITSSASGQSGSVRYEFVLIPRVPGSVTIPPFELSYFDPTSGAYRTVRTGEHTLRVAVDSTQRGSVVAGNVGKEEVKYLGEDIRHIYLGLPLLHSDALRFTGSWVWWLLVLALLVAFVVSYGLLARRQRLLSDVAHTRGRRASNVAKRRLRQARRYLEGDEGQFYEVLLRAMWSFLSDSLNVDMAELTADRASAELLARGVPEEQVEVIRAVIDGCEYARYAPSAAQVSRAELYENAQSAIALVHASLRQRGRSGGQNRRGNGANG